MRVICVFVSHSCNNDWTDWVDCLHRDGFNSLLQFKMAPPYMKTVYIYI